MWKCIHNAHRIRKYWENIPEHEHCSLCPVCNVEESMEHILLECNSTGPKVIWGLAKAMLEQKQATWPHVRYGTILGCCIARQKAQRSKGGTDRLFRIVATESAHLIWKLRCERRITQGDDPDKQHSIEEIHNRWLSTMNQRLTMDRLLANRNRYGKKALKPALVIATWDGVLYDQESLPENWIQQSGVLVGMRPQRPPGRNR
jgi:hypothetical protein